MSVSLPSEDVKFLDSYASAHDLASRSAAVQSAVTALRLSDLADDYCDAWEEWQKSEESALWAATVADGI